MEALNKIAINTIVILSFLVFVAIQALWAKSMVYGLDKHFKSPENAQVEYLKNNNIPLIEFQAVEKRLSA